MFLVVLVQTHTRGIVQLLACFFFNFAVMVFKIVDLCLISLCFQLLVYFLFESCCFDFRVSEFAIFPFSDLLDL